IARRHERVEVRHDAVLPEEGAAVAVRGARHAHYLAPFVDAMGFAVHVSGKRAERPDSIASRPEERAQSGVGGIVAGLTGKPDDVTPLLDGHARVPRRTSQVADGGHRAVRPEHDASAGASSHRPGTGTRDAHEPAP